MNMFTRWLNEWKTRLDGQSKVIKDCSEMTASDLDYCLQYFIAELRKQDHRRYPPCTLKEIIACIQHHFQNSFERSWSVFKDAQFFKSRKLLDAEMKLSAKKGNVKPKKRAAAISLDFEDALWNNGTFGRSNPKQLVSTLIYHLGLHFALRACQEHRDLEYGAGSQITLEVDPHNRRERLRYVEKCSKNKKFGIKQCRLDPKVTFVYSHDNKYIYTRNYTRNIFRIALR